MQKNLFFEKETSEPLWYKFKIGSMRERFDGQRKKYLSYAKLKRKTHKKERKRIKSLLNLLSRGLDALQALPGGGRSIPDNWQVNWTNLSICTCARSNRYYSSNVTSINIPVTG